MRSPARRVLVIEPGYGPVEQPPHRHYKTGEVGRWVACCRPGLALDARRRCGKSKCYLEGCPCGVCRAVEKGV